MAIAELSSVQTHWTNKSLTVDCYYHLYSPSLADGNGFSQPEEGFTVTVKNQSPNETFEIMYKQRPILSTDTKKKIRDLRNELRFIFVHHWQELEYSYPVSQRKRRTFIVQREEGPLICRSIEVRFNVDNIFDVLEIPKFSKSALKRLLSPQIMQISAREVIFDLSVKTKPETVLSLVEQCLRYYVLGESEEINATP